ncbi:4-(cytidine 5'-diphospho)-2-C-methyl-D-erythritol kinase [Oxalobacteraceae bacterium R-40]|uniref:4-diphosphocytidyl-2-C-methyl-D-erythritol kinase n=1 Tax=Keguizhuia sedimenti TaxID=3064264 RepID=A0ABU1BJJ5_9BURK|nr:4-(cytidine 5'-diphospho)-2-C-methyl-D-erythritol kinase [Oxalobacteraceae bacterium R-40]
MTRTLHNCPAPAKLNLFLHVTGRREDGYHLLQTVFQLIDRCDTLDFELREDGLIKRGNAVPGVAESDDLTVRAAALLQSATRPSADGKPLGANIRINKCLPMGGGLGGGSSDAATTLIALNYLWQAGLSNLELMKLGVQLGADVPFFLLGENAFAEGIGEALHVLALPKRWFVVIEPGVSVPTAAIFRSADLTRDTKPVRITDFSNAPNGFGKNDLQAVAAKLFPPIAEAIKWLGKFGDARMTGSGACVFCSFESEREADRVLEQMPPQWKAWKAEALMQHPLAHLLNRNQELV